MAENSNFAPLEFPSVSPIITGTVWSTDKGLIVAGDVNLSNMGLTEIPYKFHQVSGHFDISGNCLTSFKNCPQAVGSFDCSDNPYLSDDGKGLPDKLIGNGGNFFMAKNNRSLAASLTLKDKFGILVEETSFDRIDQTYWSKELRDYFKFKPLRKKLPELEGIFE